MLKESVRTVLLRMVATTTTDATVRSNCVAAMPREQRA